MDRALILLIVLTMSWVTGCGGALKPGETDYASVSGTFTAVESSPYEQVVKATTSAMQTLGMKPLERERDGFQTFLVGETVLGMVSQSHEVRVWVTRLTEGTTQIEMRILGRREEDRLRALHGEIRKRLAPPGQPPGK